MQDSDNPEMGWEYIKGKGEDGSDLYLDNVYVKDVFYINYRGRAYGFALTEYTDNYKKIGNTTAWIPIWKSGIIW